MADAEDSIDDGDGAAEADVRDDHGFGELVGEIDERGDEEQPGESARILHS